MGRSHQRFGYFEMNYREQFPTFGEFAVAVVKLGRNPGARDPRLVWGAGPTGISEIDGSNGGFLVPESWTEGLWQRVYATGRILARCDRQPITRGNGILLPAIGERSRADGSRFGGVQLYWLSEADQIPTSKPSLSLLKFHAKKLIGLCFVTPELLEDAPALDAALQRIYGTEASFVLEDQIINGPGGGRPLGVLKSDALITVAAEEGQQAGTVLYANFAKMAARLWGASHGAAVWLMSNETFEIVRLITDGAGQPIVRGLDGIRRILEIPVELCEYTAPFGQVGDIVLADFSQYLIAEREPDIVSSIHVKFVEQETAFRFRFRADGHPAWQSPVTPKNGTVTQSPFVTLAARA
jgi:HK97 family phage major capsid protein